MKKIVLVMTVLGVVVAMASGCCSMCKNKKACGNDPSKCPMEKKADAAK